ncbi:hypothetical protein QF035_010867 [Streptomyces umbrinus]|uniref:Transposase n=1 Tax=Streptomyces umbrinus TaxID=67370 RepID=A0ABU0TBZ2_9ACTN|nr:hypothetical protein [Streptomyces umbrinus]
MSVTPATNARAPAGSTRPERPPGRPVGRGGEVGRRDGGDGAWVAELTGKLLDGWPKSMRLIVRKERPHPGAQLRITDADGMRITCFATNTPDRPIAELEHRHRLRAKALKNPQSRARRHLVAGSTRERARVIKAPNSRLVPRGKVAVRDA